MFAYLKSVSEGRVCTKNGSPSCVDGLATTKGTKEIRNGLLKNARVDTTQTPAVIYINSFAVSLLILSFLSTFCL